MFGFHWYAVSSKSSVSTLSEIEMWFAAFSEPLSLFSFIFYLWLSWSYFKLKDHRTVDQPMELSITTKWARQLLKTLTAIAIAWVLTIIAPRLLFQQDDGLDLHYYPIELILVVLIYWITFAGYHRTKIIYTKSIKQSSAPIDRELAERCTMQLRESMEIQKLYRDPELTVAKVADHIHVPQKIVSAVLNQHLDQSFNDFVNSYRITEIKQRLIQGSDPHLTISGIAFDCGFNSQATFQRAFKSFTKQTPREFIAHHQKIASTCPNNAQIRI
jgi:AraC-like DNA-binding protein